MEFGPDDLVEFGLYYLPSLLWSVLAGVASFVAAVLVSRRRQGRRRWTTLMLCLAILPLVFWVAYFVATSELTYTLVLLGSESSQVAERAYIGRFKAQVTTLEGAVRLAVSKHPGSECQVLRLLPHGRHAPDQ